jgi:4-amino-4-deoxy-L-arabinose transferase-like glycosyltransferase
MGNLKSISWKELVFLLILACFTGLFRMQSLHLPLDREEGTIAYMAKNMSQTVMPYRDIFDYRPPLIYSVYKAAFSIFGTDTDAIRYFTTIYIIFIILLLYMLARSVSSLSFYAMLATLIYSVYMNNYMMQGLGSYPEIFAQFPVLASLFFAAEAEKGYEHISFFISGFFAAAALAMDPGTIFFILAPALYIVFYLKKERLFSLAWYLAGFTALIFLVFSWLLYRGILREFINSVIMFGSFFAVNSVRGEAGELIKLGAGMFTSQNILPLAGIIYTGVSSFRKKEPAFCGILSMTFITLLAGVMIFRGLYPHYYLILTAIMPLAAALLLRDIFVWVKKKTSSASIAAVLMGALITVIIIFQAVIMKAPDYLRTGRYTIEYYYNVSAAADMINSDSGGVVRDKYFLFAWPNMPDLYFMTGAQAATKYIYSYPLGYFAGDRDAVTGVLFNHTPVWVVLEKGTYAAFQAFLDNYYRKVMDTPTITVYRNLVK